MNLPEWRALAGLWGEGGTEGLWGIGVLPRPQRQESLEPPVFLPRQGELSSPECLILCVVIYRKNSNMQLEHLMRVLRENHAEKERKCSHWQHSSCHHCSSRRPPPPGLAYSEKHPLGVHNCSPGRPQDARLHCSSLLPIFLRQSVKEKGSSIKSG